MKMSGLGWDADPEASFCIPRSALQEGSADVGNLHTNAICSGPGFGKLSPKVIFSDFQSWPRDLVNCNCSENTLSVWEPWHNYLYTNR